MENCRKCSNPLVIKDVKEVVTNTEMHNLLIKECSGCGLLFESRICRNPKCNAPLIFGVITFEVVDDGYGGMIRHGRCLSCSVSFFEEPHIPAEPSFKEDYPEMWEQLKFDGGVGQ